MPTIKITDEHLGLLMRLAQNGGVTPAEAFGSMLEAAAKTGSAPPPAGASPPAAAPRASGKSPEPKPAKAAREAALARLDGEEPDEDDGHEGNHHAGDVDSPKASGGRESPLKKWALTSEEANAATDEPKKKAKRAFPASKAQR